MSKEEAMVSEIGRLVVRRSPENDDWIPSFVRIIVSLYPTSRRGMSPFSWLHLSIYLDLINRICYFTSPLQILQPHSSEPGVSSFLNELSKFTDLEKPERDVRGGGVDPETGTHERGRRARRERESKTHPLCQTFLGQMRFGECLL